MAEKPMSGIQKLFTRLFARSAASKAAMEAESRSWMIRCPACGYERSVWETGGVRYKAYGTSYQLRRCPHCGKLTWHKVYRVTPPKDGG
jgi:DNA-directed RNA polymerase subunit RPC12/RpoP